MAGGEHQEKPISLFYSYSHRDEAFRSELEAHLSFLRRSKLIAEWHDRMIGAGDEWKGKIDRQLAAADIILLLVSADFIASDYCWGEEMTKALARHQLGEARVIPVILRPCRWQSTRLGNLQAVPKDGKPVSQSPNHDAAFDEIAAAIEHTIADLQQQRRRAAEQLQQEAVEAAVKRAEAKARQAAEEQQLEAQRPRERKEAEAAGVPPTACNDDARRRLITTVGLVARRLIIAVGLVARKRAQAEARQAAEEQHLEAQRPREREEAAGMPRTSCNDAAPGRLITAVGVVVLVGFAGVIAWQQWPTQEPETFADCGHCPEMVVIPDGKFTMGSPPNEKGRDDDEGPQREVTVKRLAIGKYEVTVGEYRRFVEATGHQHKGGIFVWSGSGWKQDESKDWHNPGFEQTERHPVSGVSWLDAKAYVEWLAKETGKAYRLPTEAEWEYAARAGTTSRYYFGDQITNKEANFNNFVGQTTKVGIYPANLWGLYDMHGNVWEWVEDPWHDSYKSAPLDGSSWNYDAGRTEPYSRLSRGGSWGDDASLLRSANRNRDAPKPRIVARGFRVARTLD